MLVISKAIILILKVFTYQPIYKAVAVVLHKESVLEAALWYSFKSFIPDNV